MMKRNGKKKGYFRYCDDVLGLAKTKAEAVRDMMYFRKHAMEKVGVVLKANAVVSPIGRNISDDEKRKRHKKRKRQRGGRWKKHRLSGILLHTDPCENAEVNKADIRTKSQENQG